MTVDLNILGGGYIALVAFLWIVAGLDYRAVIHGKMTYHNGREIPKSVTFLRIAFIVLWFMAAFRGLDVTNDTNAYWRTYQRIYTWGFAGEKRMEVGFVGLCVLLSHIFPNAETGFHALLLLSSSLCYFTLEQWIEKHAKSYGVCILAFYFLLNASYMSAIRQSMAVAIVLLGLNKLERKRYMAFFLSVAVATAFHSSAIISLVFIFFVGRKYSRNIAGVVLGVAVLITTTDWISDIVLLLRPGTMYVVESVGNLLNVVVMAMLYITLLFLKIFVSNDFLKIKDNPDKKINNGFYNYCIITTLALTIMSLRVPVLSRCCLYFTLAGIPYISNVMLSIKGRRLSFFIKAVFGIAVWAYSLLVLLYRPEWQHLWPYHFYWNN